MKPITPQEVVDKKLQSLPDEVIEAANELIASNWNGTKSTFTQIKFLQLLLGKLKTSGKKVSKEMVFTNHWLDIEDIYRKEGWKVEYDKPAYNESYEATFTFTKK